MMAWKIIYDPEANVAALVDPDAPAALGPVAIGEDGDDPRHPLREFVDGLETPPDEMATWPLFNEWAAYVRAIVEMVEREVEAANAEEGAEPPPAASVPTPEGVPSAPETPEEAPGAPAGGAPPDPVEEGTPPAATAVEAPPSAAPAAPGAMGEEECWMCHGEKRIDGPNGRVDCPVCEGKGSVLTDAPE